MRNYLPHIKMAIIETNKEKVSVGLDMEKVQVLYIAFGNVKWCRHFLKQYVGFSNN